MARKTQLEKEESRTNIVAAAATLFRERGIEGTSVSDIMKEAGMTHGGFYRHFGSKEELVTEAIAEAFKAGLDVFQAGHEGTFDEAISYIDQYLSIDHVERPAEGCPIPILSAEIARGGDPWHEALASGASQAARKLSEGMEGVSRSEALALLSAMVGTLVLARGVGDSPLRSELLEAGAKLACNLISSDSSGSN